MNFIDKKYFADALAYNNLKSSFGWSLVDEGKLLVELGLIEITTQTDTRIDFHVKEKPNHALHTVIEKSVDSQQILLSCDCKQGLVKRVCKHELASALFVHRIFAEEIKNSWENRLLFVNATQPKHHEPPVKIPDYFLIFALVQSYEGWKILPLSATLENIPVSDYTEPDAAGMNWDYGHTVEFLEKHTELNSQFKTVTNNLRSPRACINAVPNYLGLAKLLQDSRGNPSYYSSSAQAKTLPGALEILAENNFPLFFAQSGYGAGTFNIQPKPLEILTETASVLLDIENTKSGDLRLQFHLYLGKKLWKITKKPAIIFRTHSG